MSDGRTQNVRHLAVPAGTTTVIFALGGHTIVADSRTGAVTSVPTDLMVKTLMGVLTGRAEAKDTHIPDGEPVVGRIPDAPESVFMLADGVVTWVDVAARLATCVSWEVFSELLGAEALEKISAYVRQPARDPEG